MTNSPTRSQRLDYGRHEDQHATLSFTAADAAKGTAVLVHGGYWRERIDASVMSPMVQNLLDEGWNTANVEYRRGPAHAWPTPARDVNAAVQLIRSTVRKHGSGPLILIGHSVGGQLALLNADLSDAVVGLAPVTDVVRIHDENLGESAAAEYFGMSPGQAPEIYRDASAVRHPAPNMPVLLVHGENDDRVPISHSQAYVQALDPEPRIDTLFRPALDHFEMIDPAHHHWTAILNWMDTVSARAHAQ